MDDLKRKTDSTPLGNLPFRHWDDVKEYDSICVVPSGKRHDSGYSLMYVIGMGDDNEPIEIAASCDDLKWHVPQHRYANLRTDMFFMPHVIHFWHNEFNFEVGVSKSSVDIRLVKDYE